MHKGPDYINTIEKDCSLNYNVYKQPFIGLKAILSLSLDHLSPPVTSRAAGVHAAMEVQRKF